MQVRRLRIFELAALTADCSVCRWCVPNDRLQAPLAKAVISGTWRRMSRSTKLNGTNAALNKTLYFAPTQRCSSLVAGPIQMVMLYYSCEGVTNLEHLSRLDGPQFRSLLTAAKALTPQFTVEELEDIFLKVAMSEATLARRVEGNTGQSYLTLPDLLIAIVHVAHRRYDLLLRSMFSASTTSDAGC